MYLVYAVEYDMKLEFQNIEDMLNFDKVIKEDYQVIDKIENMDSSIKVIPQTRYCNEAFYHYLSGEDYQ